jgi:hypothetical protein
MPVVVNVAVSPVSPSGTALPAFIGLSTALPWPPPVHTRRKK